MLTQQENSLNPNKLLIVDGLNVVRRIYEANLAPDSTTKVEGAFRSTVSSLGRALQTHAPTHAVAFFDYGGSTWRHELYPFYRKSRKPMPEILRQGLPSLQAQLYERLGLRSKSYPGIEADDAIGQLSLECLADDPSNEVVVLSTDKDIAQLIHSGVKVYHHFNNAWLDENWVLQKFGVGSSLLADLLALTGDSSDDIPGVTKVGPKTAASLLIAHGSLEGVLAAAASVKGAIGARLQDPVEQANARLSRKLVAFKTDSDLGLVWDSLGCKGPNAL